jgi:DHA2 family multidrug resistance protein
VSTHAAAQTGGLDPPAGAAGGANPWLIAVVVSLATFMEVLDTTIANVALPYIAGGLAVSADEASWVVTTYLVANAIILTASSFLARMFGRKPFYVACVALFTLSSILCGFAWNLQSLLLFRVLQGLGAAAWCRSRNRSSRIPSRPRSAVRPLRCSGSQSSWPR